MLGTIVSVYMYLNINPSNFLEKEWYIYERCIIIITILHMKKERYRKLK